MNLVTYAAAIVAAYLLGSFPTGYLVGRFGKGVDVRHYGSGSTGATNVQRLFGWGGFALVFAGDFGKGFLAAWAARSLGIDALGQALAALAALVGHNFPLFLGFRGGRGVATGVGGLFATVPLPAAFGIILAALIMAATRYVSLGSLVGTVLSVPGTLLLVWFGGAPAEYLVYVVPGVLLIVARHTDNIRRLLQGTERKLGEKIAVAAPVAAATKRTKGRAQQGRAPIG